MEINKNYDRIPETPRGYVLPIFELPIGIDMRKERDSFAMDAFKKRYLISEAEKQWDSHCRNLWIKAGTNV